MLHAAWISVALTMLCATLPLPAHAQAVFEWDGGSPGDNTPDGGSGNWEASGTGAVSWIDGGASRRWTDNSIAQFGGTAGTVNLTAPTVIVDSLNFQVGGYVLQGGTIQFDPLGSFMLQVAAGTTTINSSLDAFDLIIDGPATLRLGGANSLANALQLGGGVTVQLDHADALGGGAFVDMSGATLRSAVTATLDNDFNIAAGTNTITAATGTNLTLQGFFGLNAGTSLVFGSATDTGTILFDSAFFGSFFPDPTSNVVIAGGTLRDVSGDLGFGLPGAASTTVMTGATLDFSLNPFAAVFNLLGGGNVMIADDIGSARRSKSWSRKAAPASFPASSAVMATCSSSRSRSYSRRRGLTARSS